MLHNCWTVLLFNQFKGYKPTSQLVRHANNILKQRIKNKIHQVTFSTNKLYIINILYLKYGNYIEEIILFKKSLVYLLLLINKERELR